MASITAAHPTMPLPSYARVTNLEQRLFGHRARQRPRPLPRRPGDGRVLARRRRARLQGRRHREDQGRICRPRAARRIGRRGAARFAAHRRVAGQSGWLFVAGDGRRRRSEPGPSLFAGLFGSGRSEPPPPAGAAAAARRAHPRRRRAASAAAGARSGGAAGAGSASAAGRPPSRSTRRTGPFRFRRRGRSTSERPIARPSSPWRSQPKPAPIAVLPPRRPLMQASAEKALYFSDPSADRLKRADAGRLRPGEAGAGTVDGRVARKAPVSPHFSSDIAKTSRSMLLSARRPRRALGLKRRVIGNPVGFVRLSLAFLAVASGPGRSGARGDIHDRGGGRPGRGLRHRRGPLREERRSADAAGLDRQAPHRRNRLSRAEGRPPPSRRRVRGVRKGLARGRGARARRGDVPRASTARCGSRTCCADS